MPPMQDNGAEDPPEGDTILEEMHEALTFDDSTTLAALLTSAEVLHILSCLSFQVVRHWPMWASHMWLVSLFIVTLCINRIPRKLPLHGN